jgi:hypothetical protein
MSFSAVVKGRAGAQKPSPTRLTSDLGSVNGRLVRMQLVKIDPDYFN